MSSDLREAAERSGSFTRTAKAVAWSFFGVRRRADLEQDVQRLNPVHVVVAGLIGALVFIVALVMIVRWIIASGVATA